MVLFALSLQDQVEKYGSYVGIAAFFGLAVLSLLYFAQAREVKRLREWAGRAPERAREVEERALAAAEAARRAPAPAPAPVAQPQPQPQQPQPQALPQPVGATTAAARSGTVGPAVPVAAAGTALAEEERPGEDEPVAEGPPTEDGRAPVPAIAPPADEDEGDGQELAERDDDDLRDEAEDADTDDTGDEDDAEAGDEPAAAPAPPTN